MRYELKIDLDITHFSKIILPCFLALILIALFSCEKLEKEADINYWNELIENNPNDSNAYYNRGKLKSSKNDYTGAIVDYTKSLDIDPELVSAYYYRGQAKYVMGDVKGAMKDYDMAIELNPNVNYYFDRAKAGLKLGKREESINDINTALDMNNKESVILLLFAVNDAVKEGDSRAALVYYDKLIELYPNDSIYYFERAEVSHDLINKERRPNASFLAMEVRKRQTKNAISDLDKAIELNPKYKEAYQLRGFMNLSVDRKSSCEDFSRAGELGSELAYGLIKRYCQ